MEGSAVDAARSYRLRRAGPADYAAIRQVAWTTWEATYQRAIAARNRHAFLERAYSDAELARRYQRPGARLTVAEVGGQVVGYASTQERTAEAAELTSLYLLPAYHSQGMGSALLNDALRVLAANRIKVVVVSALRQNSRARRFYQRHGFEEIDRQATTLGDQTIVEVVYARALDQPPSYDQT